MKGVLNKNKINYVLYHLSLVIDLEHLIKNNTLNFVDQNKPQQNTEPGIYFNLSGNKLNIENINIIDGIPVLFPLSDKDGIYHFNNGNLIFNHDIIKSAFYLLSGYQEYNSKEKDDLGRFPHKASIQYKLNITDTPVVNYYFNWIIKGIEEFCSIHNIEFNSGKSSDSFSFLLTHDIDRIKFNSLNNLLQRVKDIFGFTKTRQSTRVSIKQFFSILMHLIGICNKPDPWWNFNFLMDLEKKYNIKSTFFFLHKDVPHKDSYYKFSDPKIKSLIRNLLTDNFEVGIHGTVRSALSLENMLWQKNELEKIIDEKIKSVRQHNLIFQNPDTPLIHQEARFLYDSSLGFAEHEGFRNSYCLPFKLYNFKDDRTFDCWEIPLNVMDVTLFHYRNHDFESAQKSILEIINEIRKFNGIFTLLWHNNHFNEDLIPGITNFYTALISEIMSLGPDSISSEDIILKYNINRNLK